MLGGWFVSRPSELARLEKSVHRSSGYQAAEPGILCLASQIVPL